MRNLTITKSSWDFSKFLILLTYYWTFETILETESSWDFSKFLILLTYYWTLEFVLNWIQSGINHDFLSIAPSQNPDEWRQKLSSAPERFFIPHQQGFQSQGTLLFDPKYVVGLADAEGCFSIYFLSDYKIRCEFHLTLTVNDANIIHSLKTFFQVGHVVIKNDTISFQVTSLWQLYYSIIPFFDQHVLLGRKKRDYLMFRQIVIFMVEEPQWLASRKTRNNTFSLLIGFILIFLIQNKKEREIIL